MHLSLALHLQRYEYLPLNNRGAATTDCMDPCLDRKPNPYYVKAVSTGRGAEPMAAAVTAEQAASTHTSKPTSKTRYGQKRRCVMMMSNVLVPKTSGLETSPLYPLSNSYCLYSRRESKEENIIEDLTREATSKSQPSQCLRNSRRTSPSRRVMPYWCPSQHVAGKRRQSPDW
jgi:hypothetical protein